MIVISSIQLSSFFIFYFEMQWYYPETEPQSRINKEHLTIAINNARIPKVYKSEGKKKAMIWIDLIREAISRGNKTKPAYISDEFLHQFDIFKRTVNSASILSCWEIWNYYMYSHINIESEFKKEKKIT